MRERKIIQAFIKAVNKDYFDAFLNEGELCMNTLKCFRHMDIKDPEIGDKYEGAILAVEGNFTLCRLSNENSESIDSIFNDGSDLCAYDENENGNILSLYAVFADSEINDPQIFFDKFKNHRFCFIKNPRLFLDMLNAEIEKNGYKAESFFVNYTTPDGEWSPYYKRKKYSYQNEYRVFFKNTSAEMKLFQIGSLKDFAFELLPALPKQLLR